MKDVTVQDWMSANPITISPAATLQEAHQMMEQSDIRHLPIMAGGHLLSLITLNDIRQAELEIAAVYKSSALQGLVNQFKSIAEIINNHISTITPEASIAEAARLMLEKKLTALPVMEAETVVGIITEADIFRFVAQLRSEA